MSYDLQRKTPLSMFSVGTMAGLRGVLFRYAIEDLLSQELQVGVNSPASLIFSWRLPLWLF
jgi:hypothetical protein